MRKWLAALATVLLLLVLLSAGLVDNDLADRYRWVCEAKGDLWIQPTHGEPYCGDGSGNPPDRNPRDARRAGAIVAYERRPLEQANLDDWPPLAPEQEALRATFERVPKRLGPGDDLHYVVALHNDSDNDIALDPCPAYYSAWGESLPVAEANEFLNCPDAPPAIPAKATVRFEMVMDLPDDLTREAGTIFWRLKGTGDAESEPAFSDVIELKP